MTKWAVKRKFPEHIMAMYGEPEKAQAEARELNSRYQCDNYVAEEYEDRKVLEWVSQALLKN